MNKRACYRVKIGVQGRRGLVVQADSIIQFEGDEMDLHNHLVKRYAPLGVVIEEVAVVDLDGKGVQVLPTERLYSIDEVERHAKERVEKVPGQRVPFATVSYLENVKVPMYSPAHPDRVAAMDRVIAAKAELARAESKLVEMAWDSIKDKPGISRCEGSYINTNEKNVRFERVMLDVPIYTQAIRDSLGEDK